ncbi:NAD-dependent epimerase/dehydratase family protein [Streptomyces sp. NBC_00859]|uniref:NAD-dependent epimerase/dehydratase family protein n=1 Tax=Streptomyces sp. NBC_00859 TaxID=2903682 RepID=UPI00386B3F3A|nr:NAD(P)-dependent oxidoreductase [Streptomyces sp. NBC_00859]
MRIVMTGATGFIGSAVLERLTGPGAPGPQDSPIHLTVLGRTPSARISASGADWRTADLADPGSLSGTCRDADVLLHLGGTLSPDPEVCHAVNAAGTAALMSEARNAGVRRIIHLSTAAVCGPGPHRGLEVQEIIPKPVSPASISRLAAEGPALDAGATVLRPGLVLGRGDRWVVPALAQLLERVPALWDGGRAKHSAVDVRSLAQLIVSLALQDDTVPAGVFHASHPQPVTTGQLLNALADLGVLKRVTESWEWRRCLEVFRSTPGSLSERQFHLLAQDHWYVSRAIWETAALHPGAGPHLQLADARSWYRNLTL